MYLKKEANMLGSISEASTAFPVLAKHGAATDYDKLVTFLAPSNVDF